MGISVVNQTEKNQSKVPGKFHKKLMLILSLFLGANLLLLSQIAGADTNDIDYGKVISEYEAKQKVGYQVQGRKIYEINIPADEEEDFEIVKGGTAQLIDTRPSLQDILRNHGTEGLEVTATQYSPNDVILDLEQEGQAPELEMEGAPDLEAQVDSDDIQDLERVDVPTAIINDYVEDLDSNNSLSGSGRVSCALHTFANQTGMGWFYLMMLTLPGMFPYLKRRFRKGK